MERLSHTRLVQEPPLMPSDTTTYNDRPLALEVQSINKVFQSGEDELKILDALDLEVRRGESVVIMGPSGSGKSTLLQILGTLDQPTEGKILLDGEDPSGLSDKALATFRNRKIGFVFQDHQLMPQCTAVENVLLPTLADKGHDRKAAVERARELLERVGLAERSDHRLARLSGGEKQRVAIARALIKRPAILLADEPTGSLDEKTGHRIADIFEKLLETEEIAVVIATHDEDFAKRFERLLRLHEGKLRQD
ncbi:MAG: ABC transporter ATP-binding protein [Candidatus Sumerlaeota bacterium]